jgi:hypothetical protein
MKKMIIAISLIVATSTTFFIACNKKAPPDIKPAIAAPSPSSKKTSVINTNNLSAFKLSVDIVGAQHNQCMDYVYDRIMEMPDDQWRQTPASIQAFVKSKCSDFLQSIGEEDNIDFDLSLLNNNMAATFSAEAMSITNQMQNTIGLFVSGQMTEMQFVQFCNNQKEAAYLLQNNNEKIAIGQACAVGQFSSIYWKSNIAKFGNFLPSHPDLTPMYNTQGEIIWADYQGAIWGGRKGSMRASMNKAIELEIQRQVEMQEG